MFPQRQQLVVAVPELSTYRARSGIGRVLHSLQAHWRGQIDLVDAAFEARKLPILRNFPFGLRTSADADLVLLPRLTGAQALCNTRGIPSVVIVHDVGIVDYPGDRQEMNLLTYRAILQSFRGLRYASHIVVVSNFSRDRLLQYLPSLSERVTVVPNGVDPIFLNHSRTQNGSRKRLEQLVRRSLGRPLLLNVGSEIPRKNMELLLGVFKRIKEQHRNAQLLKLGEAGHLRWRTCTMRTATSLGLRIDEDVLFLEHVDDTTLADAYRAADVFISTSLYEGFGLPALEAMAMGTPVVVTNQGAFPEIVGQAGWVVEPELGRFTQAVHDAFIGLQREEQIRKGRSHAAKFTWQSAAEKYLEVMQGLCK